ncbi:MAG TPA: type III-A CRISPR-associated protein Csm2 [Syntrophales bacterium]|jgi:CRISPR-associated protein Csm2|nr:type III-A CRISPR-associated protein Csm2 [Syntrophales bacterium]
MNQQGPKRTGASPIDYYDSKGDVKPELFSTIADRIGKALVEKTDKKIKGKGSFDISPTQLRRFFDDVKSIESYLDQFSGKAREEAFAKKLPDVMMLKAKAAYARGRDAVTDEFKDFIEKNVDQVKTLKDFEVFCKFFEAVYGYFYYYSASARRN